MSMRGWCVACGIALFISDIGLCVAAEEPMRIIPKREGLPDVSGLIRYNAIYHESDSLDDPELEPDIVYLWIDQQFLQDKYGYNVELRWQQGRLGDYPNEFWAQQAYGYARTPAGSLKAGILYTPFGVEWDSTYYGSLIFFKGYMNDPDYGMILENTYPIKEDVTLNTAAGYFLRDNRMNGARIIGGGTECSDSSERNTFVGRAAPTFKISERSDVTVGASALMGELESPDADRQAAVELDVVGRIGPLKLTGECVFYDQNFDNRDPASRGYVFETEVMYDAYSNERARFFKKVSLVYSYSEDQPDEGTGLGRLHLPQLTVQLARNFKVDIMRVDWRQGDTVSDDSWRIVFYLYF